MNDQKPHSENSSPNDDDDRYSIRRKGDIMRELAKKNGIPIKDIKITTDRLLEIAERNKPPQSWYDEEQSLFD